MPALRRDLRRNPVIQDAGDSSRELVVGVRGYHSRNGRAETAPRARRRAQVLVPVVDRVHRLPSRDQVRLARHHDDASPEPGQLPGRQRELLQASAARSAVDPSLLDVGSSADAGEDLRLIAFDDVGVAAA